MELRLLDQAEANHLSQNGCSDCMLKFLDCEAHMLTKDTLLKLEHTVTAHSQANSSPRSALSEW